MKRAITDYEIGVLRAFPQSEYGKVIISLIQEELKEERENFDLSAKVSDDPIQEDWRCKVGMMLGLKRLLELPQRYIGQ